MGGVHSVIAETRKETPKTIMASGLDEKWRSGELKQGNGPDEYLLQMPRQNKSISQSGQTETGTKYTDADQSGLNCGCFAAGMAIFNHFPTETRAKMIEELKAYVGQDMVDKARETNEQDFEVNDVSYIAMAIEKTATEKGYSSFGEMFSANALVKSVNETDILRKNGVEAHEMTWEKEEESHSKMEEEKKEGGFFLVPYFVGDDSYRPRLAISEKKESKEYKEQIIKQIKIVLDDDLLVRPEYMYRAHWATLEFDEDGSFRFYEGNRLAKKKCEKEAKPKLTKLYKSNGLLNKTIDLSAFLIEWEGDKVGLYKAIVKRYTSLGVNNVIHFRDESYITEDEAEISGKKLNPGDITEVVDLRGKAVVIKINKGENQGKQGE